MIEDLTPRQRQVLTFIQDTLAEQGLPPTRAEIAAALGVISKAEAQVVERARALRRRAIMVDDFPRDLRRSEIYQSTQPVI